MADYIQKHEVVGEDSPERLDAEPAACQDQMPEGLKRALVAIRSGEYGGVIVELIEEIESEADTFTRETAEPLEED